MTDVEHRNYYQLLGLEIGASTDEIKEAYREIARIYHPDSNFYDDIIADSGPEDSGVFKEITAAYQILINEDKREKYNATIPQGLTDWDFSTSSSVDLTERFKAADTSEVHGEIPEEWKAEREFFEANFEEILKPAPKVDLVGTGEVDESLDTGDLNSSGVDPSTSDPEPLTRFGQLSDESASSLIGKLSPARRQVTGSSYVDPFKVLIYLGIPVMLVVVIVELILLS